MNSKERYVKRSLLALVIILALIGCGKKDAQVGDASTSGAEAPTVTGAQAPDTAMGDGASDTSEDKVKDLKFKEGLDLSKFGVAAYPGARPGDQGRGFTQADAETTGGSSNTAVFVTDDPPSKVMDFYAKEIKDASRITIGDGGNVTGKNAAGDLMTVTVTREEGVTQVSITRMSLSE